MTLFASSGNARTFNYQAGDIGYVPASYGMFILPTSLVGTDTLLQVTM